jgi:hypothetical protein
LPTDADAALLARLINAEATRPNTKNKLTPANSAEEMAAIAFSVINRSNYLKSHPTVPPSLFGAQGSSISDIVFAKGQYGGVHSPHFKRAAHPEQIDVSNRVGMRECDFIKLAVGASTAALGGDVADPYAAQGGTYAFRTAKKGPPGGSYLEFPQQIPGSANTFFGLGL